MQDNGSSWWGRQWLFSLMELDTNMRIPRGKSYVKRGAVGQLRFVRLPSRQWVVQGLVDGSRPEPYQQTLRFKAWSAEQIEKVQALLEQNPAWKGALYNRKLTEPFGRALKTQKIPLFGQSAEDWEAECSCPDWAVPCKHLAAVCYQLTYLIDLNPGLLFQLRGLPVAEVAGESHGLSDYPVPRLGRLFHLPEITEYASLPSVPPPDFKRLGKKPERLIRFLSPKPPFFPKKDFAPLMDEVLVRISEQLIQSYRLKLNFSAKALSPQLQNFRVFVDENLRYRQAECQEEGQKVCWESRQDLDALIQSFVEIQADEVERYSPSVQFLHYVIRFCLHLVARGLCVPQLWQLQDSKYRVAWVPARFIPAVGQLFDDFLRAMPPGILTCQSRQSRQTAPPEETLSMLCALFLNHFLRQHFRQPNPLVPEDILLIFFTQKTLDTRQPKHRELPGQISLWLRALEWYRQEDPPRIRLVAEQDQEKFRLRLECSPNSPEASQEVLALKDRDLLLNWLELENYTQRAEGDYSLRLAGLGKLLRVTFPLLKTLGLEVDIPEDLARPLRPQLQLRVDFEGKSPANTPPNAPMYSSWQIRLGNDTLTWADFEKEFSRKRGLFYHKGSIVLLEEVHWKNLAREVIRHPRLSFRELIRLYQAREEQPWEMLLGPEAQDFFKQLQNPEAVPLPQKLGLNLRNYQVEGYSWLYRNYQLGLNSLLADDMGLGKTIQVLSFLQKLQQEACLLEHPALVLVPTSLLPQWERELSQSCPEIRYFRYHGPERKLPDEPYNLLLSTYGTALKDRQILSSQFWEVLLLEEAQYLKNPEAQVTLAVKSLSASYRLAISASPIENHVSDLWSILDILNPGYLGKLDDFLKKYSGAKSSKPGKLNELRRVTAPFILRRLKSDPELLPELPPKIEQDLYCSMSDEQWRLYREVSRDRLLQMERSPAAQRSGILLQTITHLKQICNHPAHYQKELLGDAEASGKTKLLLELGEKIEDAGEKALIFTQYREMGELLFSLIHNYFGQEALWYHGGLSEKQREKVLQKFQADTSGFTFMILSIKAGGLGLNLQEARHVIHFDRTWNPALEQQASNRVHRFGQKAPVLVRKLICRGTIEEKIQQILSQKSELARDSISLTGDWLNQLSWEELKKIIHWD